MLLAQVSDLHVCAPGRTLGGGVDTPAMARACVQALLALRPAPQALLLSGDLVDAGGPAEYAHLQRLLQPLPWPLYPVAGNHDERGALREAFGARMGPHSALMPDFLQYAADLGPLRLLVLDTVVPQRPHGALCARRLAWLGERLREDDRPVLIALHHPPFATGIAHMDAMGLLEGAEALEDLVRRHPRVQALLCGHVHRSIQTRFGGAVASVCPSPAHQIALNLLGQGEDGFTLEPPGFQLHLWHAQRLVSHTVPIGDHGGTRPFA
ncbi:phosphodiesterase [Hydrogenophaga crocea]|uniref:Phosphodiesterase n=1 Tax=Hydrogenophaga crocea TaxID=2716225 RepID=A0A6G8IDU5_9BURK|nr:phosphodiesterase [Hydrogenophaga crocea]QIM51170.1 phosphodiesterase [Hydrogenophaga crocea]